MRPQLNHTIVGAVDPRESAEFLAELMGFDPPFEFGHFVCVETGNGVSLDYSRADPDDLHPQHYAFLVTESEFDEIFGKIRDRGVPHWADPGRTRPNEVNTMDGGRGVYFLDPSDHFLEILTRPYGSGPKG